MGRESEAFPTAAAAAGTLPGMLGGGRGNLALAALIGAVAVAPTPAAAATIEVDGGHLRYQALPGEANHPFDLHYDRELDRWELGELPSLIAPVAPGCKGDEWNSATVYCAGSDGPLSADLDLGDGDDYLQETDHYHSENNGPIIHVPLDEPFTLTASGGSGNDTFWTTGDGAPMTFFGDDGDDWFYLHLQTTPGSAGLRAEYRSFGGEGNDKLEVEGVAPPPPLGTVIAMAGGAGNDRLVGSKGNDTLTGDSGDDNIWDLAGDDLVDGGEGNDQLYGGEGADVELGGPGNDGILAGFAGTKRIDGGQGDDQINSKNLGSSNDVTCGEGEDRVLFDVGADLIGTDCELLVIPEECGGGVTCTSTIEVRATRAPALATGARRQARLPLLGRTRFKFRGRPRTSRLPLSAKGRDYVTQRGQVRVVRTVRITHPRRHKPPRVVVERLVLTLKDP